jgi:hypothetical protein
MYVYICPCNCRNIPNKSIRLVFGKYLIKLEFANVNYVFFLFLLDGSSYYITYKFTYYENKNPIFHINKSDCVQIFKESE